MFKKIINLIIIFFAFNMKADLPLGSLTNLLNFDQFEQVKTFTAAIEKEVEVLEKKKIEQKSAYENYKAELEKVNNGISSLKDSSKNLTGTDLEFFNKQILLTNQISQLISEIEQTEQQILDIIDSNIKLLKEYKDDPEFKAKNLKVPYKSIYSIDDLQKISDILVQYENEIKLLEERLKKSSLDLENNKKAFLALTAEYEEKKREQKEFKVKDNQGESISKFTLKQQGELLDTQEKLLGYKRDLAQIRVLEADQRQELIESQIRIAKIQYEILLGEYERIKKEIRIDEKDIEKSENQLKIQIQESTKVQQEYNKKIEALDLIKNNELNQIKKLKEQYNISDIQMESISNWTYSPISIAGWTSLIEIGKLNNHIVYELDINKDYLIAQIDLEKAKIVKQEARNMTISSWHKLINGTFDRVSQDDIAKEIKQYEKLKADLQANISATVDKRALASAALNANSKITENIKARIKNFKDQKNSVFKENQAEYDSYANILKDEATESASRRSETIAHLIEIYNNITNIRKLSIEKIDTMIKELRNKMQWSAVPPLWKGFKNFIPDISRFISFIGEKSFSKSVQDVSKNIENGIKYYKNNIFSLLSLILQIIILCLIYIIIKLYLPDFKGLLEVIAPQYGIAHVLSKLFIAILNFLNNNLLAIYIWTLLFFAIKYKYIQDVYLSILFYFISIIFWIYLIYRFKRYITNINQQNNYIFISKEYQRRFFSTLSMFLYISTFILFFREAFLLANITKSDVPNTLLALNFILLQIALICIISKEKILNLIPRTTAVWQWVYDHVKKYYHLFLTAILLIIVMSNPYVGYGPKFFYVISRLFLILLLIPFFITLHNQIKRLSVSLFFSTDSEEHAKERFSFARTLYGFFVIFSFLFFVFLGIIIALNIWGYSLGFRELYDLMHAEIYGFKNEETGRHIAVNAIMLGKTIFYVIAGTLFAYFINKFVLNKIFELLLVNIGIQNAILSLTKYGLIVFAMIIGLKSIGLSSLMIYFLAVLGGLGVAGKELITDFIGYFIILVQRPIQIGDLIRIDEDINGIVRHVTLRSVILRKKNSSTVIVPNSQIMTRPVENWNYSHTYIAVDDIMLTVAYESDPEKVRELVLKVLSDNRNILKNPNPIVQLREFADYGFKFLIRAFVSADKTLDQWDIASNVRIEIIKTLRKNGIEIAIPVQVLKVDDKDKETVINNLDKIL